MAGWSWDGTVGGPTKALLVKTDALGDTVWTRTFLANGLSAKAKTVVQMPDSGYVLAGISKWSQYDIFIVRTDSNGDTLWTRELDFPNLSYAGDVLITDSGTILIAGWRAFNQLVAEYGFDGNLLWYNTYGATSGNYQTSIAKTHDGGYAISGMTSSTNPYDENFYLLKIDAAGNFVNQWEFDNNGAWDRCNGMRATSDGGFIMTGTTVVPGTPMPIDVFLVKVGPNGEVVVSANTLTPPAVSLYPNPTGQTLNIATTEAGELITITITNAVGQTFYRSTAASLQGTATRSSHTVDVSDFPNGVYFVRLRHTESASRPGAIQTAMFVVQR